VTRYLLDTNVLSELLRKRPDPNVVERVRSARRRELATSVICAMELRYGAALHPEGDKLWARIEGDLLRRIRILPVTQGAAVRAGDIIAQLRKRGEPRSASRTFSSEQPPSRQASWWPAATSLISRELRA
jgi:predicted nucleic acid-binding protein